MMSRRCECGRTFGNHGALEIIETRRKLNKVCVCGRTFGEHGYMPPMMIGDTAQTKGCEGFVEAAPAKRRRTKRG
jgi:hypothetical protein